VFEIVISTRNKEKKRELKALLKGLDVKILDLNDFPYAPKVKETGVTVHFVDEKLDNGPIILQKAVEVKDGDTEETLLERVHKVEHEIYPEAIRLFVEGRLRVEGRRVRIK